MILGLEQVINALILSCPWIVGSAFYAGLKILLLESVEILNVNSLKGMTVCLDAMYL